MTDQQQCANCAELWKRIDKLENEKKKVEKEKATYLYLTIFLIFTTCVSILIRLIT